MPSNGCLCNFRWYEVFCFQLISVHLFLLSSHCLAVFPFAVQNWPFVLWIPCVMLLRPAGPGKSPKTWIKSERCRSSLACFTLSQVADLQTIVEFFRCLPDLPRVRRNSLCNIQGALSMELASCLRFANMETAIWKPRDWSAKEETIPRGLPHSCMSHMSCQEMDKLRISTAMHLQQTCRYSYNVVHAAMKNEAHSSHPQPVSSSPQQLVSVIFWPLAVKIDQL